MKIDFLKMHGAGNDFVVVDARARPDAAAIRGAVARICDRRRGVGADGVLLLEPDPELDFAMAYYNADGSPADFCGNGARCLARFALERGLGRGGRVRFRAACGPLEATGTDAGIRVDLGRVGPPGPEEEVRAAGRAFRGRMVVPGVPHFVTAADDLDAVPVHQWGAALRQHPRFGAEGANVDFVTGLGPGRLRMRTYERGVEAETPACGSGAVASALAECAAEGPGAARVRTRGGDDLVVDWRWEGDGYRVGLSGPAETSFAGVWEDDHV